MLTLCAYICFHYVCSLRSKGHILTLIMSLVAAIDITILDFTPWTIFCSFCSFFSDQFKIPLIFVFAEY